MSKNSKNIVSHLKLSSYDYLIFNYLLFIRYKIKKIVAYRGSQAVNRLFCINLHNYYAKLDKIYNYLLVNKNTHFVCKINFFILKNKLTESIKSSIFYLLNYVTRIYNFVLRIVDKVNYWCYKLDEKCYS